VQHMTDPLGAPGPQYSFDPFGVPLSPSGGQPFGYAGEQPALCAGVGWDANTNLIYLRARW
jgi:hypothetical protein